MHSSHLHSTGRCCGALLDCRCSCKSAHAEGDADLAELRARCLDFVATSTAGYIWQRDGFDLQPSATEPPPWTGKRGADARPDCLWGRTFFGDNVDDEWLVVWLLRELTRQHANISARVWDGDGELLLIEAAYALPECDSPHLQYPACKLAQSDHVAVPCLLDPSWWQSAFPLHFPAHDRTTPISKASAWH